MAAQATSSPGYSPPAPGSRAVRRVAMVIQRFRPAFTGQGVQLEQLCQHLAGRGVRSDIFTAVRDQASEVEECDGYAIRRLRSDLLPTSVNNSHLWMPTFAARTGLSLLNPRHAFDVVHVHGLTDALYPAWIATRMRRTPLVFEMTLLGDDDPVAMSRQRKHLQSIRRAIYRRADAYVAMSEAFLPSCREGGVPEHRIEVIPQGVDIERFRPARDEEPAALRHQLGLPANVPLLVFVGSLAQRKGIDLLLRAFAQLHTTGTDAALVLVGAEPAGESTFSESLTALPAAAREQIVTLGQRPDPELVLRAADLFVFPSRREGFGSVIIEAMATALPCVVTELPGITDLIFNTPLLAGQAVPPDPDGVVVRQEDVDGLADRLTALLGDSVLRRAMGHAARKRAAAGFGFEHITDCYLGLYERLLTGGRLAP